MGVGELGSAERVSPCGVDWRGCGMSHEDTPQELEQADQHIDEFKRRIFAQEALVAELERTGQHPMLARSLLRQFRESLRLVHKRRAYLLREFARASAPRNSN